MNGRTVFENQWKSLIQHLRAKRATRTFWVDKSSFKMPKMVQKLKNSNETFWVVFKQCATHKVGGTLSRVVGFPLFASGKIWRDPWRHINRQNPDFYARDISSEKFSKKTIFIEADLAILEFWLSYLSRQSSLLNSHKIWVKTMPG